MSSTDNYQSIIWDDDGTGIYLVVRDDEADWVGHVPINETSVTRLFTVKNTSRLWHLVKDKQYFYYLLASLPVNDDVTTQLIKRNIANGEQTLLLKNSTRFTPYRIAMSHAMDKLAVAGETASGEIEVCILSLQSNQLSENLYTLPLGFTEIGWHSDDKAILIHHMNQLFTVDLNGEKEALPYYGYQRIFNPVYHPNGKRLAVSYTGYDSDLTEWNGKQSIFRQLINSTGQDHLARYSPDGRDVAFVSARSGRAQVYLYQDGQQHLINENQENAAIYRAPVWSKDGGQIFYSLGKYLYRYLIDEQATTVYPMPEYFSAVVDTYCDENTLLITTKRHNLTYFEAFDVNQNASDLLARSGTNFHARLDNKDQLVFFKDNAIHWGEQKFEMTVSSPLNGIVVPVDNRLMFQSEDGIYTFDGKRFERLQGNFINDSAVFIDAATKEQLLFVKSAQDRSAIVEIH